MKRTYFSNIRSAWPIARQEGVLDEAVPDWRSGSVYKDVLSRAGIKRQSPLKMREGALLRPHARESGYGTIYVASLGVLAWTPTDLFAVMLRIAARRETLAAIAEAVNVDPTNADIDALKAAFQGAVRRFSAAGVPGGEASGAKRMAEAQAKIERIRPYWPLPSEEYPTMKLCEEHGISRPTVIQYLGSRAAAQQRHKAGQIIAESNRRRKSRGSA